MSVQQKVNFSISISHKQVALLIKIQKQQLQHRDNITMVIKFNNNGYNVIVLFSVQNTVKPPPATTSRKWLPIENTLELRYTKPPYFKVLGITNDFLYRSISVEKNLDILTKPCYSRQILPFPKPFVNWCSTVLRSVSQSKYYSWFLLQETTSFIKVTTIFSHLCEVQQYSHTLYF